VLGEGGLWRVGIQQGVKNSVGKYGVIVIYVVVISVRVFRVNVVSFEWVKVCAFLMVM
jgi:hypothetical protein